MQVDPCAVRDRGVDPKCPGWGGRADDYISIRVDEETIEIDVEFGEDGFKIIPPGVEDRIKAVAKTLMATQFAPSPHKVSSQFRPGSILSLDKGGDSAVAVGLGLAGAAPAGDVHSIDDVFLAGKDIAIAIEVAPVMAAFQPALDAVDALAPTIPIHVETPWYSPIPDIDTVYRVQVNPPAATWQANGDHALIKLNITGSAQTDSILPNATFTVDQDIAVRFDQGSESLTLTPAAPSIDADVGGPFGGLVEGQAESAIRPLVEQAVRNACAQAQPQLRALTDRKATLVDQLRTLDRQAAARFVEGSFTRDNVILRGRVTVAPRTPPVVEFADRPQESAFDAFASWIPGGRIDELRWSWRWYQLIFIGKRTGHATREDRFVFRRVARAAQVRPRARR